MKARSTQRLRIVVLCGGSSSEREISLRSGAMVAKTLLDAGHRVTKLDPAKHIKKLVDQAKKFDVAFLALHGAGGEDGTIQGLLESIGLPYTGSGVLASALAMDKTRAKQIFSANRLTTPAGIEVDRLLWKEQKFDTLKRAKRLGHQLVVKPVSAGSSVATRLISKGRGLSDAISNALKADPEGRCLVEHRIRGRELTIGVIGNTHLEVLPVIEIRPKRAFFDLKAKYDATLCDELCPAPIPAAVARRAQAMAERAHRALGCRGYSRSDIMWDDKQDELYLLETNTLPGMTKTSLLPKAAAAAGLDFAALLERMLRLAVRP